ncbi:hypothetical protein ACDQ55_07740 [Chitinophaga sp. 30R24]|uniref:hypothetical protein n=1 Tax=Chitinophaga sp. 30R24 TaxID=3248838 RepID=UPI003B910611
MRLIILYIILLLTNPVWAQSIPPQVLGTVVTDKITEASGIASSVRLKGCYWTHNDSGGKPEVYLLNGKAALISTVKLNDANNYDWEDIAEGIGPEKSKYYVYVGDIGDNLGIRNHIRIYRFLEPEKIPGEHINITPDVLTLKYPNGARDAESLLIDPIGKKIYILSKREKEVSLYKTDQLFFKNGDKVKLQKLIKLPYTWITSGDISKDGHHIVIKTLTKIYYWHRNSNESVEEAMSKPARELPYTPEKQGEGITITSNNDGYVTISEGKYPLLNFYKWKFE